MSEPPSDALMFRYLTLKSKKDLNYSNLIEAPTDMIDIYYYYLKKKGLFDYIDDIISPPHKEHGIILNVKFITWNNVNHIISNLSR